MIKCYLCKKSKSDHLAGSLHCPAGRKSRTVGYTSYHPVHSYQDKKFLIGDEALFKKSGSIVKLIFPQQVNGKNGWIVRRIDSDKEMIVPETALKRI